MKAERDTMSVDPAVFEALKGPREVKAALEALCRALEASGKVTGVVLYGSLARDHYVPHHSDVNVVVLLVDGSAATLAAIGEPLRKAFRTARIEPLLLTAREVERSADVFPTKFQHLCARHVVLWGTSPFATLVIDPEHLRLRVEQELRNLSLRVRRRAIAAGAASEELERILGDVLAPTAIEVSALLSLLGKSTVDSDDVVATLRAGAEAVGSTTAGLEFAAQARSPEQTTALFDAVLQVLERGANAADTHGASA
jgi:predicted nucleotidyltransferase